MKVEVTPTVKARATRALAKIRDFIAEYQDFTGKKPTQIHVKSSEFDALDATNQLNKFGIPLARETTE